MALWVCRECGCKFAVGLSMCPQCTSMSVDAYEEGDDEMAKTTVHGGASDAALDKEVESSQPDTTSSESIEKPQTSQPPALSEKPKSAPTTEPPSKKDHKASSTAPSTGTGQK